MVVWNNIGVPQVMDLILFQSIDERERESESERERERESAREREGGKE